MYIHAHTALDPVVCAQATQTHAHHTDIHTITHMYMHTAPVIPVGDGSTVLLPLHNKQNDVT